MSRSKQKKENNPNQASNQESPFLKVVIAIIGATALIIVALINRSTATLPAEFTQTAEARHTLNAMTSQASQASLITLAPTETSIPLHISSPITTSTWTPDASTATSAPTIIFEDSFIDNSNNWYIDNSTSYIAAGKYTIDVSCPNNYDSFYCGTYIKIPFTFPKDFRMEMDVTVLESSSDANIAIGFQVRRRNYDQYYINYFITDSYYSLKLVYNNRYLEIIPKTSTNLISKELSSINRFGIEVQNSIFTPIINGEILPQGEDGNLINAGDSYIEIFITRGNSAMLQFDNLAVQEVK